MEGPDEKACGNASRTTHLPSIRHRAYDAAWLPGLRDTEKHPLFGLGSEFRTDVRVRCPEQPIRLVQQGVRQDATDVP